MVFLLACAVSSATLAACLESMKILQRAPGGMMLVFMIGASTNPMLSAVLLEKVEPSKTGCPLPQHTVRKEYGKCSRQEKQRQFHHPAEPPSGPFPIPPSAKTHQPSQPKPTIPVDVRQLGSSTQNCPWVRGAYTSEVVSVLFDTAGTRIRS